MPVPRYRLKDARCREYREAQGVLGAYSRAIKTARDIDYRTREGKVLSATRNALAEHLGGEAKLTAPQRALIERCAMLQLRLTALDAKILDGSFSEYDSKTYLAWQNSLVRTLAVLGIQAAGIEPPGSALDRHLAMLAERQEGEIA